MHLYRIDIYTLNPDGSIIGIYTSEYADTPEKVLTTMDKWEGITAATEPAEGEEPAAYHLYKAVIKVAKYEDMNIAQFKAMYR